jgi:hypothetical protein
MRECERDQTDEISESCYAGLIMNQFKLINPVEEREKMKLEVVKVLLASTWTQRLYFIIRSVLMTQIAAALTIIVIWNLGSINAIQSFLLGLAILPISLMISRLFDPLIYRVTRKIVKYLGEHNRLRVIILKNF